MLLDMFTGPLKGFGWALITAGIVWVILGGDNIVADSILSWRTHSWDRAARSIRENGSFYVVPGAAAAGIGTVTVLRANRRPSRSARDSGCSSEEVDSR